MYPGHPLFRFLNTPLHTAVICSYINMTLKFGLTYYSLNCDEPKSLQVPSVYEGDGDPAIEDRHSY